MAQSRPGHFRGVATVVTKLLDRRGAGLCVLRAKGRGTGVPCCDAWPGDLRLPTEIVVCPIVREPDGLALSSRNVYLSAEQRRQALALSRAVRLWSRWRGTDGASRRTLSKRRGRLRRPSPQLRVDYIALVDWATLQPVETAAPGTLFAVAAWVGETRLIDNTILS